MRYGPVDWLPWQLSLIIAMVIVVMRFVTMAIVTMVIVTMVIACHTFQIFESAVYPPDDTWHRNVNKDDRGSKRINKAVSPSKLPAGTHSTQGVIYS